jgi:hypothetical protein
MSTPSRNKIAEWRMAAEMVGAKYYTTDTPDPQYVHTTKKSWHDIKKIKNNFKNKNNFKIFYKYFTPLKCKV